MTRHRFGDFVVDTGTVEVIGPDGTRPVEPQVFEVLAYLLEQNGRLVTKEELLDNVWGDRFVSESTLTTRIKQARRAVDDDGRTQWAIKTVHGRGYRFVADLEAEVDEPTEADGVAPVTSAAGTLPDEVRADARQLFCGREAELQQCREVLDGTSQDGPMGWIWILGEPGIGKTRLAAKVAGEAHAKGHRVLFGRNSEDLTVPYQPFVEVMRQAGIGPDEPLPPGLEPLFPGIGDPGTAGPDGAAAARRRSAVDDETHRYRMFEAVATWLGERATDAPLTVVVDDAHWAADSTLQLISHLQRTQEPAAVTFVLTSRDTAPDTNPKVSDLLAAGQGLPNSTILRLDGLSEADAVRLVGSDVDLGEVMAQTAGNPLFLQAVNREDGSVDMRSAVHRRLASLDDQVQSTLRLVSVLGLEFELRVAAAANRRDELELLDDLEQAVAARLVDDVGLDRFRFTHALVRSSLRSEISSSRQSRMHRDIAEAIAELHPDDPAHLPALAHHTAQAAAADPAFRPLAIDRLRRAAHESMSQFSYEEAAELLGRAREFAGPGDRALVARLALEQGVAQSRAGNNVTAVETLEAAVEAARDIDDPLLRIEAALSHEDATWRPGLPGTAALENIREAVQVLDDATDAGDSVLDEPTLRARLAVAELRALAMSGRRAEADRAFETALRHAEQLGSADAEASVLNVYLGHVTFHEGSHDADHMIRRLVELEPSLDDAEVAMHAVHLRLLNATLTGRSEGKDALLRTMAELQQRSRSSFWQLIRTNQEAMEAFYRGDLEASERLAEHCLELADAIPGEDGSGTYGLRMFMIRREQDRLAAMAPLVRRILSQSDSQSVWTPGLALLLVETGAMQEASEALDTVRSTGFDLPIDAMWSTVMVLLIEAMVQLGDAESCSILRDRFEILAGTNVTTGSGLLCFGRADRYLGMLSHALDEPDLAEEQLGRALEGDSAGGSVLWSNESRLWLARTRRAQGHSTEADAMASVVLEQAAGAGLHRLERLAKAELAR